MVQVLRVFLKLLSLQMYFFHTYRGTQKAPWKLQVTSSWVSLDSDSKLMIFIKLQVSIVYNLHSTYSCTYSAAVYEQSN